MTGSSRLGWFVSGLLQAAPLVLIGQEQMLYTRPATADFIHPSPVGELLPGGEMPSENAFPGATPLPVMDSQILFDASKQSQEMSRSDTILDFWFGSLAGPDYYPQNKTPIWFANDPEIGRQILGNFERDMINAQRGDYNVWRNTPRGRLALVLLLDQFPRHAYRNRPQEFMFDRMATALVLEGIQKGDDKKLLPIERAFFYLPLEHSEDLHLQNLSVANYRQLLIESPEQLNLQMQDFLQTAIMHQQQIARFGRFPYRNAILGRESTPEETVFLMQSRNSK